MTDEPPEGPARAPARKSAPRPQPRSNRFLIISLVIAFPLLLFAFAHVVDVFIARPLLAMMPPPEGFEVLVVVTEFLLAAFMALGACRFAAGFVPRRDRDEPR